MNLIKVIFILLTFSSNAYANCHDNNDINDCIVKADKGNADAQYNLGNIYLRTKESEKAFDWYLKSANQGHKLSQEKLSLMYALGIGVKQSDANAILWNKKSYLEDNERYISRTLPGAVEGNIGFLLSIKGSKKDAIRWYKKSAELGNTSSQTSLAFAYRDGDRGVPEDYVLSYMWANIVAAKSKMIAFTDAKEFKNNLKKFMTPYQVSKAQELSRNYKKKKEKSYNSKNKSKDKERYSSSGTGFRVSKKGMLITNNHVVEGCNDVKVNGEKVTIKSTDSTNDLALLQGKPSSLISYFRAGRSVRLGDNIIVTGYPLRKVLGDGLNVTTGTVASLSGLSNNIGRIQITAPVNSGNSGGPVFDDYGRVVGVVVSKINNVKAREILGEEVQGANFAIKGSVVKNFLDINDVDYEVSTSNKNKSTADITENSKGFTVFIECWK